MGTTMKPLQLSVYGGVTSAEVLLKDVTGNIGLCRGRLTLTIQVTGQSEEKQRAYLLSMDVDMIASAGHGRFTYVANVQAARAIGASLTSGSRSPEFQTDVVLDPRQIEALDALREGGDLTLSFRAHLKYERRADAFVGDAHSQQESITLNAIEWSQLLRNMGHTGYVFVEIPIPAEAPSHQRRAVELLAEADRALRTHTPKEAIEKCRQVLESLCTGLEDASWLRSLNDRRVENTKEERIGVVRRALQSLNHLAMHEDPIAASTKWNRNDAIAAVGLTASIVRWYLAGNSA